MAKSPTYSSPDVLAQIANLSLRARRVVEGTISGLHKSPYHGFNVEFAEYREYSPGDDLRRLDWRVFGRSDKYFIKQFEEESNLRATLVMDASASMKYGSGKMTKYDYAATAAASLATMLIEQQDPVGLAIFDNQSRKVIPPAATQAQLARIHGELENSKPDRETDLGQVMQELAEQIKRRGLIVIFSDMLTDLDKFTDGLNRLQYRGHEIIVVQLMDRDELELPFNDLVLFRDIEGTEELYAEPWGFRKAYRAAMEEFMAQVRKLCGTRGVDHVLVMTDQDVGKVLSYYLHARERSLRFGNRGPVLHG